MLGYKSINEAYSFAKKVAAKKTTEPDEIDLAGAPLEASKQNLDKPEAKLDQDDTKSGLQKLLGQAKDVAKEHPVAAGALGALAAGAAALGVKKLLNRKKKTA